jgi:hypothetical protein
MKSEIVPIFYTLKKFQEEKYNSKSIENDYFYLGRLPKSIHLFFRNNIKTFTQIFGKHNLIFVTSEFNFRVWVVSFKEKRYFLFSAEGKGTCYESPDTISAEEAKCFFGHLLRKIKVVEKLQKKLDRSIRLWHV